MKNFLKGCGKSMVGVATPEVVAKPIKGCRTAHYAFSVSIPCGVLDTCHISVSFNDVERFSEDFLINRDVLLMCDRYSIESYVQKMKDVKGNTVPFRMKETPTGAFRLVLIVLRSGSTAQIIYDRVKCFSCYHKF